MRVPALVSAFIACVVGIAGCSRARPADLVLLHGRVYTFRWGDPGTDGTPARDAPHDSAGWHPDAAAVAVRGDTIVYVGNDGGVAAFIGPKTRTIDLAGRTAIPGLIDAHVHLANLGARLRLLDLTGVRSERDAVERVAAAAATTPRGQWISGAGWDEGAWVNRYPTMELLSRRVPDHPVYLRGLHGFAAWGNRLAFDRAGITPGAPDPPGGQIVKDARGQPTGILLNSAVGLLASAVPPARADQLESDIRAAAVAMAQAGFVSVHEAGATAAELAAIHALDGRHELPVRVYVMLLATDTALMRQWLATGPDTSIDEHDHVLTRAVKAFADGALGSRGARLLEDYEDRPGHRGISGGAYGYDASLVSAMMRRGFQAAIHAIGDAANRQTLDYFSSAASGAAPAATGRHRIEHAQVVSATDIPRFASAGVIASMQPSHAVEDLPWAEARLGATRIRGAYAWRTLRRSGARLVFSSDLPATDYSIFYGLHSAVTRTSREGKPDGGWYPNEALTAEETLRAFTTWAAYAEFTDDRGGQLAPGRRADITVLDIDPLVVGGKSAAELLKGRVFLTVAGGHVVHLADGR
jgi:predicted amidohydrolase YtcJ